MKLDKILLVSLDNDLTDNEWQTFKTNLHTEVKKEKLRGIVLDLSKIIILDSYASNMVNRIIKTLNLIGLRVVVVGIQPEVAFAMIQLGIQIEHAMTALNLDDGLQKLKFQGD